MYYGKAKKIIIHHANNVESFALGKKFQLLSNSEIIEIKYEQPQGFLGSTQLNIYIKYIIRDFENKQTVREVFFTQHNGDVLIERDIKNE